MKLRYVVAAPLLLLIIAGFSPQPCCADPENVRIGLITDTHTTRERTGDEPLYEGHLEEVISSINQADVEVVLAAGDLTQDGTTQQMSDFQQQIKAFVRPVYVVPGNHDVGQKHNSGKQGEVTEDRVALYEQYFGLGQFPAFGLSDSTRLCWAAVYRKKATNGLFLKMHWRRVKRSQL